MDYFSIFLLSLFLVFCIFCIIFIIGFIILCILKLRLIYAQKKYACLCYKLIQLAYQDLLICRREYHKAKFIDDSEKKQKIQSKCIENYTQDLIILSNPEYTEYKKYLTKKQRKNLEETLALPRYELF